LFGRAGRLFESLQDFRETTADGNKQRDEQIGRRW
jgi:hypothetical protein